MRRLWRYLTSLDLTVLREEVVFAIVALWFLVAWKTYALVRTVNEGVALMGSMTMVMGLALGAVLAAKVANGKKE